MSIRKPHGTRHLQNNEAYCGLRKAGELTAADGTLHAARLQVEADSYWCLCKLLDSIQDHYTYAQPGIQRTVFHLKELVRCVSEMQSLIPTEPPPPLTFPSILKKFAGFVLCWKPWTLDPLFCTDSLVSASYPFHHVLRA